MGSHIIFIISNIRYKYISYISNIFIVFGIMNNRTVLLNTVIIYINSIETIGEIHFFSILSSAYTSFGVESHQRSWLEQLFGRTKCRRRRLRCWNNLPFRRNNFENCGRVIKFVCLPLHCRVDVSNRNNLLCVPLTTTSAPTLPGYCCCVA